MHLAPISSSNCCSFCFNYVPYNLLFQLSSIIIINIGMRTHCDGLNVLKKAEWGGGVGYLCRGETAMPLRTPWIPVCRSAAWLPSECATRMESRRGSVQYRLLDHQSTASPTTRGQHIVQSLFTKEKPARSVTAIR